MLAKFIFNKALFKEKKVRYFQKWMRMNKNNLEA